MQNNCAYQILWIKISEYPIIISQELITTTNHKYIVFFYIGKYLMAPNGDCRVWLYHQCLHEYSLQTYMYNSLFSESYNSYCKYLYNS